MGEPESRRGGGRGQAGAGVARGGGVGRVAAGRRGGGRCDARSAVAGAGADSCPAARGGRKQAAVAARLTPPVGRLLLIAEAAATHHRTGDATPDNRRLPRAAAVPVWDEAKPANFGPSWRFITPARYCIQRDSSNDREFSGRSVNCAGQEKKHDRMHHL